jgi:hypothetical protein
VSSVLVGEERERERDVSERERGRGRGIGRGREEKEGEREWEKRRKKREREERKRGRERERKEREKRERRERKRFTHPPTFPLSPPPLPTLSLSPSLSHAFACPPSLRLQNIGGSQRKVGDKLRNSLLLARLFISTSEKRSSFSQLYACQQQVKQQYHSK